MVGTKVWCLFDESDLLGIYTTREKALARIKKEIEFSFLPEEQDEIKAAFESGEDTCGFFLDEVVLE